MNYLPPQAGNLRPPTPKLGGLKGKVFIYQILRASLENAYTLFRIRDTRNPIIPPIITQPQTYCSRHTNHVLEYFLAALMFKCIELQIKLLFSCRYTGHIRLTYQSPYFDNVKKPKRVSQGCAKNLKLSRL